MLFFKEKSTGHNVRHVPQYQDTSLCPSTPSPVVACGVWGVTKCQTVGNLTPLVTIVNDPPVCHRNINSSSFSSDICPGLATMATGTVDPDVREWSIALRQKKAVHFVWKRSSIVFDWGKILKAYLLKVFWVKYQGLANKSQSLSQNHVIWSQRCCTWHDKKSL